MKDADYDNEPLPFTKLGSLTERLLATHAKQDEKRGADPQPGHADYQDGSEQRAYVDRRLRELAAFERRASGKEKPRRPRRK